MPRNNGVNQLPLKGVAHTRKQDSGSLESELAWIALSLASAKRRNAEILIARWGFGGKPAKTLQEVGNQFDLTRERVRQIEARAWKIMSRREFETPYLDKAISILTGVTLQSEDSIVARFRAEHVTRSTFHIEGLVEAARLCGKPLPIVLSKAAGAAYVVSKKARGVERWLIRTARKFSSSSGTISVADITDLAIEKFKVDFSESAISELFASQPSTVWLDAEHTWFWIRDVKRNRLRNQILKVISISNSLQIGELRDAVLRWHRMQGIVPPRSALGRFCEQIEGIRVEDGRVIAQRPPDPRDILGSNELTLVDVLRENNGVMQRADLEAQCLARHMNVSSFYVYLGYSSLIEKLQTGVYALRGSNVYPGQIDMMKQRSRSTETITDYGWTGDGRIWIGMRMSHSILVSGVISVPAGLRDFLQGDFSLCAPEGSMMGQFKCSGSQAWSLSKFWRRRGGDEGDLFVLVWDISARRVTVYLGAEDVDDVSPAMDFPSQMDEL